MSGSRSSGGGHGAKKTIIGTQGDDVLNGSGANDKIHGRGGNDTLDGGAGSDRLKGGSGNDVLVYRLSENAHAHDRYDGGNGTDTLRLELTGAEYARADVRADIERFLAWLDERHGHGGGRCRDDGGGWFEFRAFDLDVRSIERLDLRVDGVPPGGGDRPVNAVDDAVGVSEGGSVAGNVLANDSAPDGVAAVALETGPANGALTLNPNGSFVYVPGALFESLALGETATESFSYRLTDADGDSDTATVTLRIAGANDAPVAAADAATLEVRLAEQTLDFEGAPDPADIGGFSFTGFLALPNFGAGGSAVVYSRVDSNALPDGADGAIRRTDGRDFALFSLDIAAYFVAHSAQIVGFDDGVQVTSLEMPALGTTFASGGVTGYTTLEFDASWASIDEVRIYAPDVAADEYTFIDNLRTGLPAGGEDAAVDIDVLSNDSDVDNGAVLRVAALPQTSAHGALLSLNADGSVRYDPTQAAAIQALDEGESLLDTFCYRVSDEHGALGGATVSVTVFGLNDAPVARDDVNAATDDGVEVFGNLLANDSDPEGEPFALVNPGTFVLDHGVLTVAADGSYSYLATDESLGVGDTAQEVFLYSAGDGDANGSGTLTIALAGSNDAPEAQDDSFEGVIENTLGFEGATDASNLDGYTLPGFLTFDSFGVGGTAMGYATDANSADGADGWIERIDGADFALLSLDIAAWIVPHAVSIEGYNNGTLMASLTLDTLGTTYESGGLEGYTSLAFGAEWSSLDQVRFIAPGAGEDHTLIDNVWLRSGEAGGEDAAIDIDVTANDLDVDANDVLGVVSWDATSALGAAISLNADGTLRYDPAGSAALQALAEGDSLEDSFSYMVGDGHGGFSGSATVAVRVAGAADAPVALLGDDGDNVLYGRDGDDTLEGAGGGDTLTGGPGADTFVYRSDAEGVDTITDFVPGAGGDALDIRDVLLGYEPATPGAFVRLQGAGSDTTVLVNADGAGDDFVALATLQGQTGLLLDDLLATNNLIVS